MFDRLGELAAEHAELERTLADAAVHADPERARAMSRRYGEITPIVETYREWQQTSADEATARELASEDPSFAAEAEQLAQHRAEPRGPAERVSRPPGSQRRQGRHPGSEGGRGR